MLNIRDRRIIIFGWVLSVAGALACPPISANEPCLLVTRTMGFRPFAYSTATSDHSLKRWGNGDFEYAGFGEEDTGYRRTCSLSVAHDMWKERTQAMNLSEMTEPALPEPKIADLPKMDILIQQEAAIWRRRLQPNHQVALKLHQSIQEVVMGAVEIPKSEFKTVGKILDGGFPPISQPRILKDAESAKAFIKQEALSHVDWESQQVLLFSPWGGSGQDSLIVYAEDNDANETVLTFQYKAGRTRDLRVHARAWVIDKDQLWRFHSEG
ncbi:MAG: hypothetical protein GY819_04505 [Planctomycetaceae bacterium]|nr:hypothetical protein [Planctomycetaceae bacterium]